MIDDYLSRIAYDGPREPTLAVLRELHVRHMLSVPFENLDIHWQRPIVVDADRFLHKIIRERRGGFCYELNGAFAMLLRALGFDVTMLSGRVISADGTYGPPFDHMALMVKLADGSRWLADVGFGDSFLAPLNLDERGEQHDPAGVFRIVEGDEWAMQIRRGDAWDTEYLFTLDAHEFPEYTPMCDYQQTSPQSPFTKKKVCSLATVDGRVTLSADKLVITKNGVKEERPVTAEEWEEVLRTTFAIEVPSPRGAGRGPG